MPLTHQQIPHHIPHLSCMLAVSNSTGFAEQSMTAMMLKWLHLHLSHFASNTRDTVPTPLGKWHSPESPKIARLSAVPYSCLGSAEQVEGIFIIPQLLKSIRKSSYFTNLQLGKSAKFLIMDIQKNTLKTIQEILTQPSNINTWIILLATVREVLSLLKWHYLSWTTILLCFCRAPLPRKTAFA